MNHFYSVTGLVSAGGIASVVLVVVFLVILIVIVERTLYFNAKSKFELPDRFEALVKSGQTELVSVLERSDQPAGYVLKECLLVTSSFRNFSGEIYEEVKERAISEKIPEMERYLNVLAIFGTISPFIGLLGTVFGIIRAFVSLDHAAAGSMQGLNTGIAEALVATAAGLSVAIPSTIAYNVFRKKVDALLLSIEVLAARMKIMLMRDE